MQGRRRETRFSRAIKVIRLLIFFRIYAHTFLKAHEKLSLFLLIKE